MKKYIIVKRGGRGEVEDVRYEESELGLMEFCNSIFEEENNKRREELDEEEIEGYDEYMEEFGGVSEIEIGLVEVCFSEEEGWEVCERVG